MDVVSGLEEGWHKDKRDISSHIYFEIKLKFDEAVSFNGEHLGAYPQTCGFLRERFYNIERKQAAVTRAPPGQTGRKRIP